VRAWLKSLTDQIGESRTAVALGIVTCREGYTLPKDFALSKFRGLLHCEVVRTRADTRVISYWIDAATLNAQWIEFSQALGSPSSAVTGVMSDARTRTSFSLWPTTIVGWLERVAAVCGLVAVVYGASLKLFAAPNADVGEPILIQASPNDTIESKIRIANRSRTAPVRIDLRSTRQGVTFEPKFIEIPESGSGEVILRAQSGAAAEEFDVEFVAVAGWLYPSDVINRKATVTIWRSFDRTPMTVASSIPTQAAFSSTLSFGKGYPKGMLCQATTIQPGPARFRAVSPAAVWDELESTDQLAAIKWTTPDVGAFQTMAVTVFLQSSSAIPDWKAVADRTKINCGRVQ